ncbi:hypothetical protein HYV11_01520 [Candidatus Dependentiae bacterium]|nr:hypothetical protein [Candidatus Dependentiae bacterium]
MYKKILLLTLATLVFTPTTTPTTKSNQQKRINHLRIENIALLEKIKKLNEVYSIRKHCPTKPPKKTGSHEKQRLHSIVYQLTEENEELKYTIRYIRFLTRTEYYEKRLAEQILYLRKNRMI